MLKPNLKWLLAGVAVVLGLLQLKRPEHTNPPVEPGQDLTASNAPPAAIVNTIHAACYNCHSDQTEWPWYSYVAPISWWIVDHVETGRDQLNFSDWPHDDPGYAARTWKRISEKVRSKEMPLPGYTWIHSASRLSLEQRKQLADWAEQQSLRLESVADSVQP